MTKTKTITKIENDNASDSLGWWVIFSDGSRRFFANGARLQRFLAAK